jgi:hypothetical protein
MLLHGLPHSFSNRIYQGASSFEFPEGEIISGTWGA